MDMRADGYREASWGRWAAIYLTKYRYLIPPIHLSIVMLLMKSDATRGRLGTYWQGYAPNLFASIWSPLANPGAPQLKLRNCIHLRAQFPTSEWSCNGMTYLVSGLGQDHSWSDGSVPIDTIKSSNASLAADIMLTPTTACSHANCIGRWLSPRDCGLSLFVGFLVFAFGHDDLSFIHRCQGWHYVLSYRTRPECVQSREPHVKQPSRLLHLACTWLDRVYCRPPPWPMDIQTRPVLCKSKVCLCLRACWHSPNPAWGVRSRWE